MKFSHVILRTSLGFGHFGLVLCVEIKYVKLENYVNNICNQRNKDAR